MPVKYCQRRAHRLDSNRPTRKNAYNDHCTESHHPRT